MTDDTGQPPKFQGRFKTRPAAHKQALKEAVILAAIGAFAWALIERTDTCTRFFQFVSANPHLKLDTIIMAGMFLTLAVLLFAVRRWSEAARAERVASNLAYHDTLTGLPNRRAFMEALDKATRGRQATPFVCMLLDLDNFKQVNDLRGHVVGDRLLQLVAERLASALGPDDLVARLGGDEFALLFRPDGPDGALSFARFVGARVHESIVIEGRAVQVGMSAGLARFPDDAVRADALLRRADIALFRAKSRGCGAIRAFEADMEETDRRHAAVAEALRQAIPKGEIAPHYQPVIDLTSGEVVGFEVLSRWQSPVLGPVAPREFIPIAMESGLIGSLCCRVLHQACTEAAQWPRPLRISFNLAPRQLSDPLVPIQLLSILSQTGLAPHRLDIEMTEDALLENDRQARANLEALKSHGISLTLDDFGSGYSSLHHLRTLPFDRVKIDRTYVSRIANCGKSRRMVEAILTFIHSLGVPVVAEGVETREQEDVLKGLGCDFAQGWLYGKAVANLEIEGRHFERAASPRPSPWAALRA